MRSTYSFWLKQSKWLLCFHFNCFIGIVIHPVYGLHSHEFHLMLPFLDTYIMFNRHWKRDIFYEKFRVT